MQDDYDIRGYELVHKNALRRRSVLTDRASSCGVRLSGAATGVRAASRAGSARSRSFSRDLPFVRRFASAATRYPRTSRHYARAAVGIRAERLRTTLRRHIAVAASASSFARSAFG
ncbi:MAG: hypothetical protein DCC68_23985 [Planctomycetota bacterium]|nr:MAG: hypothetical protein DCC68_23985 [Planctomycetota bacterium]